LNKLKNFQFDKVINEDPLTHRRVALEESTDIYTWLFRWLRERDIKINIVCPAAEVHIRKYTRQNIVMVREAPDLYGSIIKPYIPSRELSEHTVGILEQDKVLFSSSDFVILPDMKWDLRTILSLYLVALVQDRETRSLRDFRKQHIPLLKAIENRGERVVEEKWALGKGVVRMYIHPLAVSMLWEGRSFFLLLSSRARSSLLVSIRARRAAHPTPCSLGCHRNSLSGHTYSCPFGGSGQWIGGGSCRV
ncbi:Scavenger mRNA-decapping enzyme DcpS, partial [Termitomyces sp. J132]